MEEGPKMKLIFGNTISLIQMKLVKFLSVEQLSPTQDFLKVTYKKKRTQNTQLSHVVVTKDQLLELM